MIGGVAIGLTGGLAAPLVAAGVGAVFGTGASLLLGFLIRVRLGKRERETERETEKARGRQRENDREKEERESKR